jgi:hypothetical protein
MVRGRKEGIYKNNKNKFLYTKCGSGVSSEASVDVSRARGYVAEKK